jgi:hypothetical protein
MRRRKLCLIPRGKNARGKVLGALPDPARGTPAETSGPLSRLPHVPERSSPSRGSLRRAKSARLDGCGPFRRLTEIRESGQLQSPFAALSGLPLVGPSCNDNFEVDKPS